MNVDLSQNYFELFGLHVGFELDVKRLAEQYRELQKAVHPDKFASASDRDRRMAVQQAALINEAYHTLKSPLKRARYLLQLKGIEFDDQRETSFDPEFLMEQMELREALAEIKQQPEGLETLARLMTDISSKIKSMTDKLALFIGQDDLDQAKAQVHKLQFLEKLMSECEAKEEDLVEMT